MHFARFDISTALKEAVIGLNSQNNLPCHDNSRDSVDYNIGMSFFPTLGGVDNANLLGGGHSEEDLLAVYMLKRDYLSRLGRD
jgi:hypothetical protein